MGGLPIGMLPLNIGGVTAKAELRGSRGGDQRGRTPLRCPQAIFTGSAGRRFPVSRECENGFTLVELFVVIGITGLLISVQQANLLLADGHAAAVQKSDLPNGMTIADSDLRGPQYLVNTPFPKRRLDQ